MKVKRGDYCPIKMAFFWKLHNGKEKWVSGEELKEFRAKCAMQARELRAKDPQKTREHNRKSYHKDLERSRRYQKEWRLKNLDRRRRQQREYNKHKRLSDPFFLLKSRVKIRTASAIRRRSLFKSSSTAKIIGCDWVELKRHIESKFTEGMGWDNRNEWHIDHIIPISSAKTEELLIELCHYSNLQPLWASENMSKGSKIILDYSSGNTDTTPIV